MSQGEASRVVPMQLWVFTFKEGLLARAAHDLRLRVEKVTATATVLPNSSRASEPDVERLTVTVDPSCIFVDGAMEKGELNPHALSPKDHREIESNLRKEVLKIDRYPEIRFEGSIEPRLDVIRVAGELELHGVKRRLETVARSCGDRLVAEFELRPTDFGIAPFKALMGAIRLQDKVMVLAHAKFA